jgi:hypothetical protein
MRSGSQAGLVEVRVTPDTATQTKHQITTQEQYAAFVQYTLAKNELMLNRIFPGPLPKTILFGEQEHPKPKVQYDFRGHGGTPDAAGDVIHCLCIIQSDGGYACAWWRE